MPRRTGTSASGVSIEEYVARLVAAAPPLTAQQKTTLGRLFEETREPDPVASAASAARARAESAARGC